jgi:hypothetical protein
MFKDWRTNVHDEDWSGWPFVVSNDIVQSERWCFTTSELSCEFPQILRKMGSENTYGCTQDAERLWCRFFRAIPQTWWRISQSHLTGDEIWFHLWLLKPKSSQSSGCTHFHKTSQRSLHKHVPVSWWQLFSGTGKEC